MLLPSDNDKRCLHLIIFPPVDLLKAKFFINVLIKGQYGSALGLAGGVLSADGGQRPFKLYVEMNWSASYNIVYGGANISNLSRRFMFKK